MIGGRIEAVLPRLRAEAESIMRDACMIREVVGESVDPDTGAVAVVYGATLYEGRCKVQDRGVPASQDAASADRDALGMRIDLPVGPPWIPAGAVATVLDTRRFRVLAPHRKTYQTAQRLPVEEVT